MGVCERDRQRGRDKNGEHKIPGTYTPNKSEIITFQILTLHPSLSEFPTVYCDPHKGFGIVNKLEIYVFLELSCFFNATLLFYKTRQLATWPQVSPKYQVQTGFQAYSSKKK